MVVPPLSFCWLQTPALTSVRLASALTRDEQSLLRACGPFFNPSLMTSDISKTKAELRSHLRAMRQAHVEALTDATMGLLFRRPPAPLSALIPEGATIGVYNANAWEAPAQHYASHFAELGHVVVLPRFGSKDAAMGFAKWADFYGDTDLVDGPYGLKQPADDSPAQSPDVLFVPLIGFGENGERLGQGGGHYDRWLSRHPNTLTIGLAWDCQLSHAIPMEEHDRPLRAVVTPTRLYGPFDA